MRLNLLVEIDSQFACYTRYLCNAGNLLNSDVRPTSFTRRTLHKLGVEAVDLVALYSQDRAMSTLLADLRNADAVREAISIMQQWISCWRCEGEGCKGCGMTGRALRHDVFSSACRVGYTVASHRIATVLGRYGWDTPGINVSVETLCKQLAAHAVVSWPEVVQFSHDQPAPTPDALQERLALSGRHLSDYKIFVIAHTDRKDVLEKWEAVGARIALRTSVPVRRYSEVINLRNREKVPCSFKRMKTGEWLMLNDS